MTMGELLVANLGPFMGAFALAAIGLAAAIPLVAMLRWWAEGTATGGTLLGLFAGYFVLLALILGPSPVFLKWTLVGGMVAGSLGLPYLSSVLEGKSAESLEQTKESSYRYALQQNPRNVAARAYLAESLFRQGRVDEAIEELEAAVALAPTVTQQEARRLAEMKSIRAGIKDPARHCPKCEAPNAPTRTFCHACGAPLSGLSQIAEQARKSRQDLAAALAPKLPLVVVVVVGLALLPMPASALLSVLAMGVALVWLWRKL